MVDHALVGSSVLITCLVVTPVPQRVLRAKITQASSTRNNSFAMSQKQHRLIISALSTLLIMTKVLLRDQLLARTWTPRQVFASTPSMVSNRCCVQLYWRQETVHFAAANLLVICLELELS
jgi:hypothetical protein